MSEHGAAKKEPQPVRDHSPDQIEVFPHVHKDLLEREAYGREEYGGPLVTNDGRDNDWDAYQEALDLAVYLRKGIIERTTRHFEVKQLKAEIAILEGSRSEMRHLLNEANRKLAVEKNNTALVQERLDNAQEVIKTQKATIKELLPGDDPYVGPA